MTKVLTEYGVRDINREDIDATLDLVARVSGIKRHHMVLLGSGGKQPASGDIDVAVDKNNYDPHVINSQMIDMFAKGIYNTGTKIGSYAVPIAGNIRNGMVQVDLMYVKNPLWAEFAYFSKGEGSKYKGAVRAILLSAVAASMNKPGRDAFVYDENDMLLARVGWGIDPNLGLKRMIQLRKRSKRNGSWLKTMEKVRPQDIRDAFPDIEFEDHEDLVIDDPDRVVNILFGPDVTADQIESAEDIMGLVRTNFPQERVKNVFMFAAKRLAPLKDKMNTPKELE